jgi:hypothetical protein
LLDEIVSVFAGVDEEAVLFDPVAVVVFDSVAVVVFDPVAVSLVGTLWESPGSEMKYEYQY